MTRHLATLREHSYSRRLPARLVEFLHFDIQSTGQKSLCVNIVLQPSQSYVLIRQSDSPCPYQFWGG
ncbi:hypothetical protein BKA91DRAFT_7 [Yarrowia lipolytica]|nr:hypothetical protein BKA91DRAFT_7 [Yarrowia lipolytica]